MLKSVYSEGVKSDETTLISSGVRIEGKVTSAENFRVGGEIQGNRDTIWLLNGVYYFHPTIHTTA